MSRLPDSFTGRPGDAVTMVPNTGVTKEGIERFKKARPNVLIVWRYADVGLPEARVP